MDALSNKSFGFNHEAAAERIERAWSLAKIDVESGNDPRTLTGDLVEEQETYMDRYVELLVQQAAAKEAN